METHGGTGRIFYRCYSHLKTGVVFEKDSAKTAILAQQRPGWAVYEGDCEHAIRAGVGFHLPINFVDLDSYGEPWRVIDALFQKERCWPDRVVVVVNDGLRHKLTTGSAWHVASLQSVVRRHGNAALYPKYLQICRELLAEKVGRCGFKITKWAGYYVGQMTHYGAVLQKT
jgi:hypothetical protein